MQEAPLMLKNKTARRIKDIPGFVFPGGVRVIINFTVDFDAMIFRKFLREPKLWCAQGEFGGRTGLWRLLDVFGEFDVRTTLFLPGQTGLLYPEVLRRAVREGHEIANHMWDHHIPPTLEEEAVHIDRTDTLIKGLTGQYPAGTRPEGWFTLPRTGDDYPGGSVSEATGALLLEAGCGYFGNSMADDIPRYWITDYDRRHTLLMLPYYYAMDTQFFMFFPGVGKGSGLVQTRALWENWAAELEGVRAWGRQSTFVIQPYLMQFGAARAVLDRLMRAVTGDPDLWSATSGACAAYWKQAYPADRTLRFEKAAWLDEE